MKCIAPTQPSNFDLLDYLDGQATPQVNEHLRQCAFCAERAKELRQARARRAPALLRLLSHPSRMELGEYDLRLLPRKQTESIRKHLRECPHCRNELWQQKSYAASLVPTPPAPGLLDQFQVWFAQLVSPGPRYALAWGLKSASIVREDEPAMFEVNNVHIALSVSDDPEQPERKQLLGQITLDQEQLADVDMTEPGGYLCPTGQPAVGSPVEFIDRRNFAISGLLPGEYQLILELGPIDIHLPPFEIQ